MDTRIRIGIVISRATSQDIDIMNIISHSEMETASRTPDPAENCPFSGQFINEYVQEIDSLRKCLHP